jgi:hypothetical protein
MAIDKKKVAALAKISDKGFDTEKKVMAIDIDVIDENDLTKEITEIRGLKKAIKNHDVIAYLCNGTDPVPVKKEAKKDADDDRNAGSFNRNWDQ